MPRLFSIGLGALLLLVLIAAGSATAGDTARASHYAAVAKTPAVTGAAPITSATSPAPVQDSTSRAPVTRAASSASPAAVSAPPKPVGATADTVPVHRGTPPRTAWGAFVPGAPSSIDNFTRFESAVGKHAGIVMWYEHWGGPYSAYNPTDIQTVVSHGSVPMVTWMSDDPTLAGYPSTDNQKAYRPANIAGGAFDDYIKSWADGLRDSGQTVLLRFDHEMNGNWYAWSPGVNGTTAADYIAMWTHVRSIFTTERATNVKWLWSPNAEYPGATPMASVYPGDAQVDWVALDGYNWGSAAGGSAAGHTWQTFTEIFQASYRKLVALTSRPVMIAETGCVEGSAAGQSKADWITNAFGWELFENFPRVAAIVWFDQADGEADFRVNSSAAAQQAFGAAIRSPRFMEQPPVL